MKINLAVSTLNDSFSSMTEHLMSEYMEALDEFIKWQESGHMECFSTLCDELVDIQYMSATIGHIYSVDLPPEKMIHWLSAIDDYIGDAAANEAWIKMTDDLMRAWDYMRTRGKESMGLPLSKSEQRNIKAMLKKLIITVEAVLTALDLSEDERNRYRRDCYEKNRMRGYYD